MRQAGLRLGRIFGIEVSADLGVLFIGALFAWSLAAAILPATDPGLSSGAYWSVGALGALLFLLSVLAHELGHSVVARANDIEVEGITLWLFGGVAQFKSDARTPGAEFCISAAGPAVSALISAVSLGGSYLLTNAGAPDIYATVLWWLGVLNGLLAVFNLLPGAPLDGGRVLAAVIWKVRGDRLGARIWAARAGKVVGLLLIAAGFAEVFLAGGFGGLWTAFIGWFLLGAARMEEAHYIGEQALGELAVSEAMVRDPRTIRSWATVADAVDGPLRAGRNVVPVVDGADAVVGAITMDQVKRVPAEAWGTTPVQQVMVPSTLLVTVTPEERVTELLDRMHPALGGIAVVLDHGHLVGIVTPTEIQRAVALGRMVGRGTPVTSGPAPTSGPPPTHLPPPPPPPGFVPQQRWEPPAAPR